MTILALNGRRHRGVAMIEFALVLPMLMFIALLMIFFGKAMLVRQDTVKSDRHFAWRQAKHLADPQDAYDGAAIREKFFRDQDVSYDIRGGWSGPRHAEHELVDQARVQSSEAGDFANDVILRRFPGNVNHAVDLSFGVEALPLHQFAHDLDDRYYRLGVPWRHRHVSIWSPVRDHFINDFDQTITSQGTDGGLVHRVRQLYLRHW